MEDRQPRRPQVRAREEAPHVVRRARIGVRRPDGAEQEERERSDEQTDADLGYGGEDRAIKSGTAEESVDTRRRTVGLLDRPLPGAALRQDRAARSTIADRSWRTITGSGSSCAISRRWRRSRARDRSVVPQRAWDTSSRRSASRSRRSSASSANASSSARGAAAR